MTEQKYVCKIKQGQQQQRQQQQKQFMNFVTATKATKTNSRYNSYNNNNDNQHLAEYKTRESEERNRNSWYVGRSEIEGNLHNNCKKKMLENFLN